MLEGGTQAFIGEVTVQAFISLVESLSEATSNSSDEVKISPGPAIFAFIETF